MKWTEVRNVIFPNHIELRNGDLVPNGALLVGLRGTEYKIEYDDGGSAGKVIQVTLKGNDDKVNQFRNYLKKYYKSAGVPGEEEKLKDYSFLRTRAIDIPPEHAAYSYAVDYPPSGGGKTRKRKRKSHKRKSHKRKSHKRKSHKRKSRRTRRR